MAGKAKEFASNNLKKAAPQKAQQTIQNAQDVKRGVKDAASAVKNFYAGSKVAAAKDAVKAVPIPKVPGKER